jgi:catechol 2,3-dioxygenase-like lactoylglutathione lyase family enzyme
MISGGNATVYVSNMDAAIQFYTTRLGFALTNRFGNQWATLDVGSSYWTEGSAGLTIGLHPASSQHAAPGTAGGIGFGFETYMPIAQVVSLLTERGVGITSEIIRYEGGNCVMVEAADGLPTYINEFPPNMLPDSDLGPRALSADSAEPSSPQLVSGGHAIVYVSNMDAGVRFYSEKLGMRLTNRYGDNFATVEAGNFILAVHPRTPRTPEPGKKGSVVLGLQVDEPMERVVSRLADRGVRLAGESVPPDSDTRVEFEDEDGNALYLWEAKAAASRVAGSR